MRQVKFLAVTFLPLLVSGCDVLKASGPEFEQCKEVYLEEYLIPINNGAPETSFKSINTWISKKEDEGRSYIKVTFDSLERNTVGTPVAVSVACRMSKKSGVIKLHSIFRNNILVGGPMLNAYGDEQIISKHISGTVDLVRRIEELKK